MERLAAALGLVHSFVVQIACANLRNRHAWMFFRCASFCINAHQGWLRGNSRDKVLRCISGLGVAGRQFLFSKRNWIIYQLAIGKRQGREKEKKTSRLALGVWYATYVALPIYSYKISCSSSGGGIYKHRNVD